MHISVEQIKPWKVALKVVSDSGPVEQEIERLYSEYASEVEIPGFRRGRAPKELLKARYGKAIETEAVEKAVPSVYRQAIKEKSMNPITQAEIDEVSFEPGRELSFKATFEVVPDLEVKDYEGLPISDKTTKPSRDEIEERIGVLRRMSASVTPVAREARTGDHLTVDYVVLDEDKKPMPDAIVSNYSLPLGQIGQKELDEGLLGVKAGDVKEVMVSFPPEATDRRVAGKRLPVRMKIREVKETLIPELNEDFAKDVGADSLKALRLKVKEELTDEGRRRMRAGWEKEVVDGLIERNQFEPPESLIDSYLKELAEKDSERAVWFARRAILLEKLATDLNIVALEEDIDRRIRRVAEDLKGDYKKIRHSLEMNGHIEQVESSIRREKVLDYLIERAKKVRRRDGPNSD